MGEHAEYLPLQINYCTPNCSLHMMSISPPPPPPPHVSEPLNPRHMESFAVSENNYLQVVQDGLACQPQELHASTGVAEAASPQVDVVS